MDPIGKVGIDVGTTVDFGALFDGSRERAQVFRLAPFRGGVASVPPL
jgi:hypothetical protein